MRKVLILGMELFSESFRFSDLLYGRYRALYISIPRNGELARHPKQHR